MPTQYITGSISNRMLAHSKAGPNGCVESTYASNGTGYGVIRISGRMFLTHRVAWEMVNGPVPDGMEVCHNCPGGDNKRCINPEHLFLGTHDDNMKDAARKGMMSRTHGKKGETNSQSKLTEADVIDIRAAYANGESRASIARRHHVSSPCIGYIVHGKTWAHVE